MVEKQGSRRRDDCTVEQGAQLYHKFDNAQDSDCARARMSQRQWRRMLEVVMPEVVVVSKLGR